MSGVKNVTNLNPQAKGEVNVSIARSRFSTSWKPIKIKWNDFIDEYLKEPVRGKHTVQEYRKMSVAEKGKVKDVGGFVGGAILGGNRKNENIQNRTVVTLDLDNIKGDSAESIYEWASMMGNWDFVMYSTHSHTPERPRLRLLIPTKRAMTVDEYEPIARKLAGDIGMDRFDDTTYEVARLMYFPSCPQDGEFYFNHRKGPFLDPDIVLRTYQDWRDINEWPVSSRQQDIVKKSMEKQEDPLEKKGLIGAFNRTYTITDAIETFLLDAYEPTVSADRWTYKGGSTSAGLVIYDDKFAYSHHATDPISGQSVNAFDLVRLHKFGKLDADVKPDTPINRYPSYLKMQEFAAGDSQTKVTLYKERQDEAANDFSFESPEESQGDIDWLNLVEYSKKGAMVNTIDNILTVLDNDPNIKRKLRYNAFANRAIVEAGVPWVGGDRAHDYRDVDDSGLYDYLEKSFNLGSMTKVEDAKNIIFEKNKFHPVVEYIEGLDEWDGVKRIESIFIDYLGAEDTMYHREVAKIHLTAAVARVFQPGIKYDLAVFLVGKQGIGKSTFIAKVAKNQEWFSDSVYTLKGKEAAELIQGAWHVELGELSALRKADRDSAKSFITKTDDVYRIPYSRNVSRFPRQCVFWGSTNESDFLRDPTGERRYLPIRCGSVEPTKDIFKDLDEDVDQIWAEAYHLYKSGQPIHLSKKLSTVANEIREAYKEDNPLQGLIIEYLGDPKPENWFDMELSDRLRWINGRQDGFEFEGEEVELKKLDKVCAIQVWCEVLGKDSKDMGKGDSKEIKDAIRGIEGWEEHTAVMRFGKVYGIQRGFYREKV